MDWDDHLFADRSREWGWWAKADHLVPDPVLAERKVQARKRALAKICTEKGRAYTYYVLNVAENGWFILGYIHIPTKESDTYWEIRWNPATDDGRLRRLQSRPKHAVVRREYIPNGS